MSGEPIIQSVRAIQESFADASAHFSAEKMEGLRGQLLRFEEQLNDLVHENKFQASLLDAIFSEDPSGLAVVVGADLRFVYINTAYRFICPLPEINPCERAYRSVWTEPSAEQEVRRLRTVIETGQPFVYPGFERMYPDGTQRFFTMQSRRIEWEGEPAALIILWDTTEVSLAEAAAREANARVPTILENITDGFASWDREWRITYVNAAAERMLGERREALLGQDVRTLTDEAGAFFRRYEQAMTSQETVTFEDYFAPLRIWLEVRAYPSGDGLSMYFRDITERKQSEAALIAKTAEIQTMTQQLWQTAKLATMGELSASIAHELNNPLAILSLRIESLLNAAAENGEDAAELQVMAQEVDRMANLVANLLQFSRSDRRQISSLDLREEVDSTLQLIQNHLVHHHILVQRDYDGELPLVQSDRQQLRQLFLNVFTNASDAMPDGGDIAIHIHSSAKKGQVEIEIQDTGMGIQPENLPKLATAFFTTKPEGKGTGLGLAICKRIVDEYHGAFRITSPGVGKGATVWIQLPAAQENTVSLMEE